MILYGYGIEIDIHLISLFLWGMGTDTYFSIIIKNVNQPLI